MRRKSQDQIKKNVIMQKDANLHPVIDVSIWRRMWSSPPHFLGLGREFWEEDGEKDLIIMLSEGG